MPEEGKEFGVREVEATNKLFREPDLESGIAICRSGFCVAITCSFEGEDVVGEDSFLFKEGYGLPPPRDGAYRILELELE